jgi:hypothetical protein
LYFLSAVPVSVHRWSTMIPQMQQQQQPPMFQSATDNSKIKMHITDFFLKKKQI